MSLFAIGDIHGNVRALDDLLEQVLKVISGRDTLVFLGDYIDRGPHVRECVDRIIALKQSAAFSVVTLLGNHEDWMLRSYHDHTAHSWLVGMEAFDTIGSYSLKAVEVLHAAIRGNAGLHIILEKLPLPYEVFFDALPPAHLQFFERLERYHQGNGVLCVHGGVDTQVQDLHSQQPDAFLWGAGNFPDGYTGADYIVYGHRNNVVLDSARWPRPNIQPNRTCGIDSIAHGVLTAIRFPGLDVFQSRRFMV
jgi:serine/threonine protein phosphatase 1